MTVLEIRFSHEHTDLYRYNATARQWQFLACCGPEWANHCTADHNPVKRGEWRNWDGARLRKLSESEYEAYILA